MAFFEKDQFNAFVIKLFVETDPFRRISAHTADAVKDDGVASLNALEQFLELRS